MFKREFSNSVQLLYVYATAQVNTRNYLAMSQSRSRCSASNTDFDPAEEGALGLMRFVRHRRKKSRYNHKHIWQELLIVQENPAGLWIRLMSLTNRIHLR